MEFSESDIAQWKAADPKEGLRLAFEFLIKVAEDTLANKATAPGEKEAIAADILSLRRNLPHLEGLAPEVCRTIHAVILRAFEVGQYAGMLDVRALGPGRHLNQSHRAKLSIKTRQDKAEERKEALRQFALLKGNRNCTPYALACKAKAEKITTLSVRRAQQLFTEIRKEPGLFPEKS